MDFADFNNEWVEIFKAGDYGDKGRYKRVDLQRVVANFNPATHTPPAVIGHPKTDSPAFGWIKELKIADDKDVLLAKFKQVHRKLEKGVLKGRFPNRSAAFYLNPEGRGLTLRHVGFLGATPPEVKGLAPIRFSDGDFVTIDFSSRESHQQDELSRANKEGDVDSKKDKKLAKQFRRLRKGIKRMFRERAAGGAAQHREFASSSTSGIQGLAAFMASTTRLFQENPSLARNFNTISRANPNLSFAECLRLAQASRTVYLASDPSPDGYQVRIDPRSIIVNERAEERVREMRRAGRREPEGILFRESLREANSEVFAGDLGAEATTALSYSLPIGANPAAISAVMNQLDADLRKRGYSPEQQAYQMILRQTLQEMLSGQLKAENALARSLEIEQAIGRGELKGANAQNQAQGVTTSLQRQGATFVPTPIAYPNTGGGGTATGKGGWEAALGFPNSQP